MDWREREVLKVPVWLLIVSGASGVEVVGLFLSGFGYNLMFLGIAHAFDDEFLFLFAK